MTHAPPALQTPGQGRRRLEAPARRSRPQNRAGSVCGSRWRAGPLARAAPPCQGHPNKKSGKEPEELDIDRATQDDGAIMCSGCRCLGGPAADEVAEICQHLAKLLPANPAVATSVRRVVGQHQRRHMIEVWQQLMHLRIPPRHRPSVCMVVLRIAEQGVADRARCAPPG